MMMLQGEKNPSKKVVKNKFHALVAERKQSAKEELDAKKRPREPAAAENTEERRAAFVVQKYEKTRDAVVQDVAVTRSNSRKAKYAAAHHVAQE